MGGRIVTCHSNQKPTGIYVSGIVATQGFAMIFGQPATLGAHDR